MSMHAAMILISFLILKGGQERHGLCRACRPWWSNPPCCPDVFPLWFCLFSGGSASGWIRSFSTVGGWKGKSVRWKLLALPPPYSTRYLNSEYMWWTQGRPKAPLQVYCAPEGYTCWDNALSKILVGWGAWLCFVISEKGATERVGGKGMASITMGVFSGESDLRKLKTCWDLPKTAPCLCSFWKMLVGHHIFIWGTAF